MFIFGLTELLREFWTWLLRPKGAPPSFFTVILKDDIFKDQLRFAEEYISWEGKKTFAGILAVDSFLSKENKEELKKIVNKKYNIATISQIDI